MAPVANARVRKSHWRQEPGNGHGANDNRPEHDKSLKKVRIDLSALDASGRVYRAQMQWRA